MIVLKKLDPNKDITKKYLDWMNDPVVHKFTEQRYKKHSLSDIKKFVKEKNKSKNEFLFGIFVDFGKDKKHVGNIKLGPINFRHKSAEISYFIGEKQMWGKGYTTIAINKVLKIAKKKGIKKVKAGLYEVNKGSERVLKKNGFKLEGEFKSELIFNKKRYSHFIYGKVL